MKNVNKLKFKHDSVNYHYSALFNYISGYKSRSLTRLYNNYVGNIFSRYNFFINKCMTNLDMLEDDK